MLKGPSRRMPTTKLASAQPIQTLPRTQEELPDTFPRDRVCSSCRNLLSIWNAGSRCHSCLYSRDEERMVGAVSVAELLEEAP